MKATRLMPALLMVGILVAGASVAEASHFRGGAIVPSVSSTGVLTITATSFWRPTFVEDFSPLQVTGPASFSMSMLTTVTDTSDSRFTKKTETFSRQLPTAGTYSIRYSSCCRVAGIKNALESSFVMNSAIVWDGSTANTPILFNFSAIQPEVVRGAAYSDNLGAVAGNGGTLSYNQALNTGITSQPPGFVVNTTTGELTIPSASTAGYLDNLSNVGADYAFSGNIINSDGSFVEFDWLFDAVNTGSVVNLAPIVGDVTVNATIGDLLNINVTGTDNVDQISDIVTLFFNSFSGPGAPGIVPSFNPGTPGSSTTGVLTWDTTGSSAGTWQAFIQGSDGSLTDTGIITINLRAPVAGVVPLPSAAVLGLAMLGGLGLVRHTRRRRTV